MNYTYTVNINMGINDGKQFQKSVCLWGGRKERE